MQQIKALIQSKLQVKKANATSASLSEVIQTAAS